MADHIVTFDGGAEPVSVPTGTLLSEAARLAGLDVSQPCGGQGRCGRCAVEVVEGAVRRRSTLRLSAADIAAGYALACQSVVEADVTVVIPAQEKIERRLATDLTAAEVEVPAGYDPVAQQPIRRYALTLAPPSVDDQTDDWGRLQLALRQQAGLPVLRPSLAMLRRIGGILREGDWRVTAILDLGDGREGERQARLVDLKPGHTPENAPQWGAAIDVGTTTVTLWLVELLTGEVRAQVAEYNKQIARGEDVISRIIYTRKGDDRGAEMRDLALETINDLLGAACRRARINPSDIVKATVAGNSTMMHLLLGIPAESIRQMPFVTAVNHPPTFTAREIGLGINPEGTVDCLPGVASYVGADISAGVLSSGTADSEDVTLFLDIGTNGETVLGSSEWLVACACSAGPAFEGGGVLHGMRATKGAIEEVWINGATYEPTYRVIGGGEPRGICGSGLISLMAEMYLTGVVDKGGHINAKLETPRTREGEHGPEYVVSWANETLTSRDIVITNVDADNLMRAKAAIYAGFTVLADSVGVPLESAERVLIGGAFGKYINAEKAIQIGLLPDMPWERFRFLGNTSVKGAYLALLDRAMRARIEAIAARMTYIELSANNTFYDAFMSASFLPHTDVSRFPTVEAAVVNRR